MDVEQRLTKLEVDNHHISENIARQQVLFEKLNSTLDRFSNMMQSVNTLIQLHEKSIADLESSHEKKEEQDRSTIREIHDSMRELKDIVTSSLKEITETSNQAIKENKKELDTKIEKVETRISNMERYRWITLGAATALGFIASHLPKLFSLLAAAV